MKTLVIASALALSFGAVAAPALADPARAASSAAAATPAADSTAAAPQAETRRYCVKGDITGSRIERKACKTRADWLKEGFDPLTAK